MNNNNKRERRIKERYIKVFFIGGGGGDKSRDPVHEYTQTFTDKLNYNLTSQKSVPKELMIEVKFLTWAEAKEGSLVRSINDYNPKVSDPKKDLLYVAIIGHSWGAHRAFKILADKNIHLIINTLILIDPVGRHGISWKKDFETVFSKINIVHTDSERYQSKYDRFKFKFINFTDYKLDWTPSDNGNYASWMAGRWDLDGLVESGQLNSAFYRVATKVGRGYREYDLLSKIKCNHADFCVMLKQCEDWLFNDIRNFAFSSIYFKD